MSVPFVVREENGVWIFELSGFLTGHADSYEFLEAVRGKIAEGSERIVVNLSGIDKINSSGIGVIAAVLSAASNAGTSLRFACVSENIREVLGVVGIGRLMKTHASVGEAIADL